MSETKTEKKENMELVAVVLVRGHIDLNNDVKDTLNMLKLFRKNYCVVLEKTSPNMGMVQKVKDVITWGEIDEKTLKILIEKRAEKNPKDSTKNKKFFRLQPPRKGFGRKGIKQPFNKGGALGYRGEKINDLIQRML